MCKTDVSTNYKTKFCKKFAANGYCPYGVRCQFIHDISEIPPQMLEKMKDKPMSRKDRKAAQKMKKLMEHGSASTSQ